MFVRWIKTHKNGAPSAHDMANCIHCQFRLLVIKYWSRAGEQDVPIPANDPAVVLIANMAAAARPVSFALGLQR
jgi:hypothetical protein